VQISRLRRMIEPDPSKPRYIQTVWGVGYVFVPDGTATKCPMICRGGHPGVWLHEGRRDVRRLQFCERRSFLQGV